MMKISDLIQKRFNKPENKGDDFGFTSHYNVNSKRIINIESQSYSYSM